MACHSYARIRHEDHGWIRVPCGSCEGCLMSRARNWSLRGMHEKAYHDESSFITLTYNDQHLASNNGILPSLCPPDVRNFLKRLRKLLRGSKIKYMLAGEYGETTGRPHYHAIIFGCDFRNPFLRFDGQLNDVRSLPGHDGYYISSVLSALWPLGQHVIAPVTEGSISYVAQYTLKKQRGRVAMQAYRDRGQYPEFVRVSQGIGASFVRDYYSDFVKSDSIVLRNKLYKPPRYYLQKLSQISPELNTLVTSIKSSRLSSFLSMPKSERDRSSLYSRSHSTRSKRGL